MIMELILLIGGILLAAAAVIFRKKLTTAWAVSLTAAGLMIAVIGGIACINAVNDMREDDRNVHIALRYLDAGQPEQAVFYLKKVKNDSFASVAAEALAEKLRGNDTLSRIKLDALESKVRNDTENTIYLSLNAVSADHYESRKAAVTMLHNALNISKGQQEKADIQYVMESGSYVEGIEIDYDSMSEEELLRMNISTESQYGSGINSIRNAARLLELKPSEQNRLLFAELIANAIYNGENISGYGLFDDEAINEKLGKELEDLQKQLNELTLSEQGLKIKCESASDEKQKEALNRDLADLSARIENLQKEYDCFYAFRALNSVADLTSLEAAVVRARLYFSMLEYDKAMKCLTKAAANPIIRMTAGSNMKNALNVLNTSVKNKDAVGTQSAEFKDAIRMLIANTGSNMIGTISNQLTIAFADYIMTEQKDYGSDLYITSMDLSAFPEISLTVAGRDTVINELVSSGGHTVKDTRYDVRYKISRVDYDNEIMDVCCVVDESGSMGGTPTQNLKAALSGFIKALDGNTRIGIVGFENDYEILCEMTDNHALASSSVSNIRADGGTDITSGIQGAIDALANSTNRKTVLLMTDGQSNIDMATVSRAAEMGCVIHCIGFGDVNHELLQSIADATGGQYIHAENASELINVYLDLVGMIGNEVNLTYTVNDKSLDDCSRYVFIQTSKTEASVRFDYTLAIEQYAPTVSYIENPLITEDDIAYAKDNGQKLSMTIYGKYLSDIKEVTVGNQTVTLFDKDGNYSPYLSYICDTYIILYLDPKMNSGWQSIRLKDSSGNEYEFDNMCCVGPDTGIYGPLTFGDVIIEYYQRACILPDGTLVLANASLRDDISFGAYTKGLLYAAVDKAGFENDTSRDVGKGYNIPKGAGLRGAGALVINGNDRAYNYDVTDIIASGNYRIVYNNDELRVIEQ
ncbi:MAG: VWA domain-containing protein [Eubacteriales bacterium]